MTAADFQNVDNTFSLLSAALATPAKLDQATLDAAEKVVRDRIANTAWASEAATLRRAADAIHKLGGAS